MTNANSLLRKSAYHGLTGLIISIVLAACGGSDDIYEVHTLKDRSAPKQYQRTSPIVRLPPLNFQSATTHVRSDCEVGVRVILHAEGNRIRGVLVANHMEGTCEVMTRANRRYYPLELVSESCGSRTYAGDIQTAESMSALVLTDHSGRTCKDRRPAMFELEETDHGGITRKFYGTWRHRS